MAKTYSLQYRRVGEPRWTKISGLVGHGPEKLVYTTVKTHTDGTREKTSEEVTNFNRMVFYFQTGGVQTVSEWTNCEILLGKDWVEYKEESAT